jgi:hypothetical protein
VGHGDGSGLGGAEQGPKGFPRSRSRRSAKGHGGSGRTTGPREGEAYFLWKVRKGYVQLP